MNTQVINKMKESSTKAFAAMAKNLYILGLRKYQEQQEHDFLASIILDKNVTESYILHIISHLSKYFDEHMKELNKNESLICVDMDTVLSEMRAVHIKALIFSLIK